MNDDTVVGLRGAKVVIDQDVNAGAVEIVRKALVMTERGEITDVVVCYTDKNGNAGSMHDGTRSRLLFAIARVERHIHAQIDKELIE